MDFSTSMKLSASGLSVQRKRMEAISSNLANIETTRTPEGGPYRKKNVVVSAVPLDDSFAAKLGDEMKDQVREVTVARVIEDQSAPQRIYNPGHPDADEAGYVAMPNINMIHEMVDLINATRSFEANIQAINSAKTMALRAIELGR